MFGIYFWHIVTGNTKSGSDLTYTSNVNMSSVKSEKWQTVGKPSKIPRKGHGQKNKPDVTAGMARIERAGNNFRLSDNELL